MKSNIIKTNDYKRFIQEIKQHIQSAQIKAAIAVNQRLLRLYWDLVKWMVVKQKEIVWDEGFISKLSHDLMAEFPDMKGFSKRNPERIRQWYLFYNQKSTIAKQSVSQLYIAT